ncbi:aminotransferase class I/II-fold pyridoxal phosphate-dependent enzyme [Spiroplasma sp. SV19]|uniref:MalY/PatB family protein n=1 Tax=Spiroplasma sp. SV19 TaxID=2570468 RepID=UPI0024B78174|nr:aminotransferase class I/II-fold pyridoxal phosphate-dependent enzyme [Spiroplasma sp. SV19]WHQ37325.1 aminotransferase class I/II-fold pyridoxal phosphate-dependent enzyme [Spiroplasma sp. SV19]
MKYNFDIIIDRSQNLDRKWDQTYIAKNYHLTGDNIINSSIADLDFITPLPIMNAILERAKKGVYSYSYVSDELYQTISDWYLHQHQVIVPVDKIKLVHGTVNALHQLVQCLTDINDYVLVQTPVYGPFGHAIINNKRRLLTNQLQWVDKSYQIDFAMFEAIIQKYRPKLFILCNPHNPGGRVWTREELQKIIVICQQYRVLIISDEVHGDLALPNVKFHSLLSFTMPDNYLIVCNSPNKAFNLGGLKSSYVITHNEMLRTKIDEQYQRGSITSPNVFTIPAYLAAYNNSEVVMWKTTMLSYVAKNYNYVQEKLASISGLKIMQLEASYLVWINYAETNMTSQEVNELLWKHKLIVSKDDDFVEAPPSCFRINIGTSFAMVVKLVNILVTIFTKEERKI